MADPEKQMVVEDGSDHEDVSRYAAANNLM